MKEQFHSDQDPAPVIFSEQTARWFELSEETTVEREIQKVHHSFDTVQTKIISRCLIENELQISVESCPQSLPYNIECFVDRDWKFIRSSENPCLALYAVNHYYEDFERIRRHPCSFEDEVYIRSLPLVHGLSLDKLLKVMESGIFLSNRAIFKKDGEDAVDHVEKFSQTTTEDRKVGLDQYTFAHFARPDSRYEQQEVTVVLDPDVMKQTGAFATEKDYLDYFENDNPFDAYLKSVSLPPYFYKQAFAHIADTSIGERKEGGWYVSELNDVYRFANGQDSQHNNAGEVTFSTWEIKLPKVDLSAVRKLIFKDQAHMEAFKEMYGGSIDCVCEPDLKPGNYADAVKIPGEYDRQYELFSSEDYVQRAEVLKNIPDDQKIKKVIVLKNGSAVGMESNPFLVQQRGGYPDYGALKRDILHIGVNTGPYSKLAGGMMDGRLKLEADSEIYIAEIEVVKDEHLYTYPNIPSRITKLSRLTYADIEQLSSEEV